MISRFCLSFLLVTGPLAHASPKWAGELTSGETGTHPRLAPTALDFQISWKGMINSGTLRMDFTPPDALKPGFQVVRSFAESKGAAAALFPYRHNLWSEIHNNSLRPRYFHAVEKGEKKTVTTTVRYFSDRVESEESSKVTKTGKVKVESKVFKFAPVFDLFSAMLHIRSQKLDTGDRVTIVIQPFGDLHLLRIRCRGREMHQGRAAIKLSVGIVGIDRKTLELKPYKKMKSDATLWLSDDADRVPLEIRAAVFIGDVRATLTRRNKL